MHWAVITASPTADGLTPDPTELAKFLKSRVDGLLAKGTGYVDLFARDVREFSNDKRYGGDQSYAMMPREGIWNMSVVLVTIGDANEP